MTAFPYTKEFSFSEARSHLADIANKVIYAGKRAILTRKGKKAVAIVSIEDLELLQAIEDRLDQEAAEKAVKRSEERNAIPIAVIRRKHRV